MATVKVIDSDRAEIDFGADNLNMKSRAADEAAHKLVAEMRF